MYHIIIVEDDPMVASINEQYVRQNQEFSLDGIFHNGRDALAFLETHDVIDLAIVDTYMPVMDGMTFLREVRARKIPLTAIMITAANASNEIEEALHLGVVDYIIKPFSNERFRAAIDRFLEAKKTLERPGAIDQNTLDNMFHARLKLGQDAESPVKGIQMPTLRKIEAILIEEKDKFLSCDEISAATDLSRITVRRYLNYLLEGNKITSTIEYATGGRPSIRYKIMLDKEA